MVETLTFSIGDDGEVTVRSYEELRKWLDKERSLWAWIVPGDGRTDRHGLATELNNVWLTMINDVTNCQRQGQPLEIAKQYLYPLYTSLISVSTSSVGAQVLDIRQSSGEVAAMTALGFLKGRITPANVSWPQEITGLILSVFPDMRDPSDWSERLKRERSNFRMAARSLTERVEAEAEARNQEAMRTLTRAKRIAKKSFDKHRKSWRATESYWYQDARKSIAGIERMANNSISNMDNLDKSYREFMSLKAPVEYWEKKADDHKLRENEAKIRLYYYFPVTAALLVAIFSLAAYFLLNHPDTQASKSPVALYFVISGGLLILSTIAFWIGRLLTKLYLSEHHLRNDAEERATMTTTYLALTGENQASETDRQIILNALFRATPDGIVKDEGPGDLGLPGLLAKAITK